LGRGHGRGARLRQRADIIGRLEIAEGFEKADERLAEGLGGKV
jgi:hypothetical protein